MSPYACNAEPGTRRAAGRARPRWCRAALRAALLAIVALPGGADVAAQSWVLAPRLEAQVSGTDALLIGISVVDDSVVWVSGSKGTWARTTDSGATWVSGVVPGADSLQFRDIHALDAANAWVLSIGNGEQSRIYRTADGGATWNLQFRNTEPRAFFDCFGFWDARHGIAISDSYDGRFHVIVTEDGSTWTRLPPERLPPANEGEGSFAASGTCLVVGGDSMAWIATGASPGGSRVLRTTDRGRTWSVAQTPIVRASSAGIETLAFRDLRHGAALGGDLSQPEGFTDNVALTEDGGLTWTLGGRPPFPGPVYGSAWVPGAPSPTLVAAGPKGIGFSADGGSTWMPLDTLNHWSVAFRSPDRGWATGPNGRITLVILYARRSQPPDQPPHP